MKLAVPNHREAFGYWLNDAELLGEGVEIGCAFGYFSRLILSQWNGKQLFMVDPWEKQSVDIYKEQTEGVDYNQWFLDCSRIAEEDARAKLIRKYSVEAAKDFQNDQLDWAYIDGNHSYVTVLDDMDNWWPKVKIGGIMCGHDFYNDTNFPHFCEVERAVIRWAQQHSCQFTVTPCSSWWILKTTA